MKTISERIKRPFQTLSDMLRQTAFEQPGHPAIILNESVIDYQSFDRIVDAVAASLQRDGFLPGEVVAVCAQTSIRYMAIYCGCLRAGGVLAPLPPSARADNLSA